MIPTLRTESERLALANQLYREFHARCFWHCPRDLVITEDLERFACACSGIRENSAGGARNSHEFRYTHPQTALIPRVVKGLRAHGARRGFVLSGKLQGPRPGHPTQQD
jgi:hypothetical protein